jgi:hypothetical protein
MAKTKICELLEGKTSPKLEPKVAKMIADLLLLHATRMFKQALIDEEDPKIIKYYSSTAPTRAKQIAARLQKGKPSFDDVEVELIEDIAEDTAFYDDLEKLLKRNKVDRRALPPVFLGASVAKLEGAPPSALSELLKKAFRMIKWKVKKRWPSGEEATTMLFIDEKGDRYMVHVAREGSTVGKLMKPLLPKITRAEREALSTMSKVHASSDRNLFVLQEGAHWMIAIGALDSPNNGGYMVLKEKMKKEEALRMGKKYAAEWKYDLSVWENPKGERQTFKRISA